MKKYTFIRESYFDDDPETGDQQIYDYIYSTDPCFTWERWYQEDTVYYSVLIEEGVMEFSDMEVMQQMSLDSLEILCLDNNIYVCIEDSRED
jgi:hypothetical protein